jgi:predicted amidohydrolase
VSDWNAVLRCGRVTDPEAGHDAVADVAIVGDRVAEIGTGPAPAHPVTAGPPALCPAYEDHPTTVEHQAGNTRRYSAGSQAGSA